MSQENILQDIQDVINGDALNTIRTELSELVNDPQIETQINPFDLFCQKTGWKIGERNENSLLLLIKVCGRENDLTPNLYNGTSFNVHPAWLDTSPECLDDLMEADPLGYACFCFDILTKDFYQSNRNKNPTLYPSADRYWALARANALMQERGTHQLVELTHELANAISFMPDAAAHLFNAIQKIGNTADILARLHCEGTLISTLRDSVGRVINSIGVNRAFTKEWIKRTRYIDLALSVQDANRGPSNVRRQKVSKRKLEDALMFSEIDKLFTASGLGDSLLASHYPSGRAATDSLANRLAARREREAELAIGIAALEGFTNLSFSDDADDENNDVEVRIISKEEMDAEIETAYAHEVPISPQGQILQNINNLQNQIELPEEMQQQPVRKLSALELLRAKRGAK